MKSSIKKQFLRHQAVYTGNINMDRQVCLIKPVAYRARTDIQQTDGQKKVKTEGPKILSNDIFYLMTVIIGGPI